MENKIKTNFADKITLDNNEILWKVNSNETREFRRGIVHAFENFGTLSEYSANSIVGEETSSGCSASYVDENFVGDSTSPCPPLDNLGYPDPHPAPKLHRWLHWSPPLPLRTDPHLLRWQPGAYALVAPWCGQVQVMCVLLCFINPILGNRYVGCNNGIGGFH